MQQVDDGVSFLTSTQKVPLSILVSDTTLHEGDRSFYKLSLAKKT